MSKSKLSELLAQRAELEKLIAETQRSERAEAIAQVRTLMNQYGLSMADLGTRPAGSPASQRKPAAKVAAKYLDSATGQTWSGRGLKPNWLKAALATGRSIDEFKI
ncbi:MAG: H-NS histone family protein [Rubrivivax sp.]|nr:H-NS histone family protein [Rubrivivax sp.]